MRTNHPWKRVESNNLAVDIYLPEPGTGYYQGKRFDWSGVIGKIEFDGHSYTGEWRDHDPYSGDSICGPADEFRTGTDATEGGPGFKEAKAGETWLKPGVGLLRKPDPDKYDIFRDYGLVDPGKWTVEAETSAISFRQVLNSGASDWGYIYTKAIRLHPQEPIMTICYFLKNTGSKTIDTQVYNHHFFTIDETPVGPDYSLTLPFKTRLANADSRISLSDDGHTIRILKPIGTMDFFTRISGHNQSVNHHQFILRNVTTGAAVEYRGFQPMTDFNLWCYGSTICPEPYIRIVAEAGQTARWKREYRFSIQAVDKENNSAKTNCDSEQATKQQSYPQEMPN